MLVSASDVKRSVLKSLTETTARQYRLLTMHKKHRHEKRRIIIHFSIHAGRGGSSGGSSRYGIKTA